jgi:glycosyltransferase involved in cell wall biosynthesis
MASCRPIGNRPQLNKLSHGLLLVTALVWQAFSLPSRHLIKLMAKAGAESEVTLPSNDPPQSPRKPPLKVCLVVDSLAPDAGTEKLVANLAAAIDPHLIEIHICCFENSERLMSVAAQVHRAVFPLTRLNSPAALRQMWKFRTYLRQNGMEAVHSFMTKSSIFSVLASIGTDCRAVITSRLNSGYWYTPRLVWIFRALNRYSTHIMTNSEMARDLTSSVERVSPQKITVFYPGVDLHRFGSGNPSSLAPLGIPQEALVVGIVANFRAVKDIPLFLGSAAVISAAVPSAAFLLVGQGALKAQLEQLAAELKIGDRVFFSSPEVAIPDYLSRMSVACLSSKSEGLPNAILEYMAAGLPVVAADVGGVRELVDDGSTGYLVRTRTPEAFAEPVIQLLRDPDLRRAMGRRGLERARADFDFSGTVVRLQQFYLDAVACVQGRTTTTLPPATVPTDRK